MPPKAKPAAAAAAPSKKTVEKKKEKIIEDKTFGLKNKKGAKQQKFIQQVQHQVKHGGPIAARKLEEQKKVETGAKKDDKLDLNQLFRPVTSQKVEKGADPKSVLCAFYKQGHCGKGDKCKFSHDLTVERKAEKRSVYVDMREDGTGGMENWDEAKLKEVVEKKHAEADSKTPKTELICRNFLDALERNKYGWFWECPNGEKCKYRHALPPGFVLNKDKKKDDKKDDISIEDLVEKERSNLGSNLTKVTLESFIAWKKKKIQERKANSKTTEDRKKAEFKAGKSSGISGREMFTFRPEMATEDQTEEDEVAYDTRNLPREDDDDDQGGQQTSIRELTLESLASGAKEADNTGTIATSLHRNPVKSTATEGETIEGAVGGSDGHVNGEMIIGIPIDENLFLDDDLDDLENELNEMDLSD